ncbi:MAG: hypothetical protein JWR83_553 [Aeromicrobium sp.]|nr:hypothetical protein [Aeromicrobium sp.]
MSSTRSSRGNPSMGDILRSIGVLALVILAIWGFGKLFTQTPDTPTPKVDYAATLKSARPAANFELLAPPTLPKGWKATSVRFEPQSWHLGVLTAGGDYIGLEQVKVSLDRAVDQFAKGSKAAGTAEIGSQNWDVRKGPDDTITYVRRQAGLTTLVTGDAPRKAVEAYVSSLSAS